MNDLYVTLCTHKTSSISTNIWAEVRGGKLTIAGQDLGEGVEQFWGDDEHEYFYNFDEPSTKRLLELIGGGDDPETTLHNAFSGLDGCKKMREICKANDIKYRFSCW